MKINEIIRTRRKELKLTQEQAAEYLGISAPAVNRTHAYILFRSQSHTIPNEEKLEADLILLPAFLYCFDEVVQ